MTPHFLLFTFYVLPSLPFSWKVAAADKGGLDKWDVHRKRIAINHYPASVSAGWQVTYFDVSKASVAAAAGTKQG